MAGKKHLEWIEPDGLAQIEGWARDGLTDQQIAGNMGISWTSLKTWKTKFPAISSALKKGKAPVDIAVENALLKSALGYKIKTKKPIKLKRETITGENGKSITEFVEYYEEETYIPPQVSAQIFWLKNRRPDKWRDKPEEYSVHKEPVQVIIDV